jgi:hypothetical protein
MITDTVTSFARKEKGTKFQQEILDKVLEQCSLLKKEDLQSCPASANSEDIRVTDGARQIFPFSIECKHLDTGFSKAYKTLEQAHTQMRNLGRADHIEPIAFIKEKDKEPLAVLSAEYAIWLFNLVSLLLKYGDLASPAVLKQERVE